MRNAGSAPACAVCEASSRCLRYVSSGKWPIGLGVGLSLCVTLSTNFCASASTAARPKYDESYHGKPEGVRVIRFAASRDEQNATVSTRIGATIASVNVWHFLTQNATAASRAIAAANALAPATLNPLSEDRPWAAQMSNPHTVGWLVMPPNREPTKAAGFTRNAGMIKIEATSGEIAMIHLRTLVATYWITNGNKTHENSLKAIAQPNATAQPVLSHMRAAPPARSACAKNTSAATLRKVSVLSLLPSTLNATDSGQTPKNATATAVRAYPQTGANSASATTVPMPGHRSVGGEWVTNCSSQ